VEQQRSLLGRGVLQIPNFSIKEVSVLRVDAGDLVEGDRHASRALGPLLDFLVFELEALRHPLVRARQFTLQLPE